MGKKVNFARPKLVLSMITSPGILDALIDGFDIKTALFFGMLCKTTSKRVRAKDFTSSKYVCARNLFDSAPTGSRAAAYIYCSMMLGEHSAPIPLSHNLGYWMSQVAQHVTYKRGFRVYREWRRTMQGQPWFSYHTATNVWDLLCARHMKYAAGSVFLPLKVIIDKIQSAPEDCDDLRSLLTAYLRKNIEWHIKHVSWDEIHSLMQSRFFHLIFTNRQLVRIRELIARAMK